MCNSKFIKELLFSKSFLSKIMLLMITAFLLITHIICSILQLVYNNYKLINYFL